MRSRPLVVAVLLAGAISSERPAFASSPAEAQLAQALFDEGRSLMDQRRFAEACPKLAESHRLDPGGGTLLNLAICHEGEGKLATARGDYEEALRLAVKDGRADRQRIARERLAAIEPMVPRIAVTVSAEAAASPGLEVKLDALVLRREAWGIAMPVDPGSHVVQASAQGLATWSETVTVTKAERKTVTVSALGPLSELPGAGGAVTSRGDEGAPARATDTGVQGHTASPARRTNPVFVGALASTGIAGAVSAVTGTVALVTYLSARSGCLPDRAYCKDESSRSSAELAGTMAWISTISLGVSAISAVVALVVPREIGVERALVRARPALSASAGGGTLGFVGTFR